MELWWRSWDIEELTHSGDCFVLVEWDIIFSFWVVVEDKVRAVVAYGDTCKVCVFFLWENYLTEEVDELHMWWWLDGDSYSVFGIVMISFIAIIWYHFLGWLSISDKRDTVSAYRISFISVVVLSPFCFYATAATSHCFCWLHYFIWR